MDCSRFTEFKTKDGTGKQLLQECHLVSLEVNVAQVQDGGEDAKDCRLVVRAEVQDLHGGEQTQEVLGVVLPVNGAVSALLRSETTDREL